MYLWPILCEVGRNTFLKVHLTGFDFRLATREICGRFERQESAALML
jgi:hypothetical protein